MENIESEGLAANQEWALRDTEEITHRSGVQVLLVQAQHYMPPPGMGSILLTKFKP